MNLPHVENQICIKNVKIKKTRTYVPHKNQLDATYVFENAKKNFSLKILFSTFTHDFFACSEKDIFDAVFFCFFFLLGLVY